MATKGCKAIGENGLQLFFASRSEAAKWLIIARGLEFQTSTVIRKVNAAIREGTEYEGFRWVSTDYGVDYERDVDEGYSDDYYAREKTKPRRHKTKSYYDED